MANENVTEKRPPQSVGFVPERLLQTDEAAAIIQIHPKTLQRFAREGMIRGIHIGKLWRFRASEIEEWIQRQTAWWAIYSSTSAPQMQRSSRRGFAGLHGQKRVPLPTASNAVSKSFSPSFPVPVGWIRGPALPSKKKPLRKHSHFQ